MTSNQSIGEDAALFFKNMSIGNLDGVYKHLIVSPTSLKTKVLSLMDEEIKKGAEGRILMKMNSVTDMDFMRKVSEASKAGVKAVSYTHLKAIVELRKKQIRNALMLLLLSQGTPCLLAGDEFGNTQKGNNNVYCQDNETAWLNWNKKKMNEALFEYVRTLIQFRKEHTSLHKEMPLLGMDKTACGLPDISFHGELAWQTPAAVYSRQLGVLYCDNEAKQDTCYIAYNMHWLKPVSYTHLDVYKRQGNNRNTGKLFGTF